MSKSLFYTKPLCIREKFKGCAENSVQPFYRPLLYTDTVKTPLYYYSNAKKASSSKSGIPSSCALVSLLPASMPAKT